MPFCFQNILHLCGGQTLRGCPTVSFSASQLNKQLAATTYKQSDHPQDTVSNCPALVSKVPMAALDPAATLSTFAVPQWGAQQEHLQLLPNTVATASPFKGVSFPSFCLVTQGPKSKKCQPFPGIFRIVSRSWVQPSTDCRFVVLGQAQWSLGC